MVARYIKGLQHDCPVAAELTAQKQQAYGRATGGMNYLKLARMAYYVDKVTYRKAVTGWIKRFRKATG